MIVTDRLLLELEFEKYDFIKDDICYRVFNYKKTETLTLQISKSENRTWWFRFTHDPTKFGGMHEWETCGSDENALKSIISLIEHSDPVV